jgi:hypothetical protein
MVDYLSKPKLIVGTVTPALKMQAEHFVLSLQAAHTISDLTLAGSNKTIKSTARPMFLFIAQARRRIDTAASSEKLGLYI